jgi:3D-(3,5/4)-trihydroxycyclohexane-1,2-dione acylhydrolase (decyclizing)
MVHASAAFARMRKPDDHPCLHRLDRSWLVEHGDRRSLGHHQQAPGAAAASDIFATRVASPVLQELESPSGYDVSVNDAFRPVSAFFDRVWRPSSCQRHCSAPCGCSQARQKPVR